MRESGTSECKNVRRRERWAERVVEGDKRMGGKRRKEGKRKRAAGISNLEDGGGKEAGGRVGMGEDVELGVWGGWLNKE